jgi:hypothetical protein
MKDADVRTLVRHRLEQAQTALDDAKFLSQGQRSPQSIVNRAYYAMFYAVLALLQQIGQVPSRHVGMISLFDREFVAKGVFPRELSRQLHRAFEIRQTSDYKASESVSSERAGEVLGQAVRFVDAVRDHLTEGQSE